MEKRMEFSVGLRFWGLGTGKKTGNEETIGAYGRATFWGLHEHVLFRVD